MLFRLRLMLNAGLCRFMNFLILLLIITIFITVGINNPEGFKKIKLRYAKKAGWAVSPRPGQSCHVAE